MIVGIAFAWYFSGLIGSALWTEFFFRRCRSHSFDITVADLIFAAVLALAGPINLIVGCFFLIGWVIGGIIKTDRVVFQRHHTLREG